MTLEQINELTVEKCWRQLLQRITPFKEGEFFTIDSAFLGDWYKSLIMPKGYTKPTLEQFDLELTQYKAEMTQEENARLEAEALEQERLAEEQRLIQEENERLLNLSARFQVIYSKDCGVPWAKGMPMFAEEVPANLLVHFEQVVKKLPKEEAELVTSAMELRATAFFNLQETNALITQAYNVMNAEVYAEMEKVFGTKNPESATANQATFALMKNAPSLFIGKLGLNTEAEVVAYAEAKLLPIVEYGIWRQNRIDAFRVLKAKILSGEVTSV